MSTQLLETGKQYFHVTEIYMKTKLEMEETQ